MIKKFEKWISLHKRQFIILAVVIVLYYVGTGIPYINLLLTDWTYTSTMFAIILLWIFRPSKMFTAITMICMLLISAIAISIGIDSFADYAGMMVFIGLIYIFFLENKQYYEK